MYTKCTLYTCTWYAMHRIQNKSILHCAVQDTWFNELSIIYMAWVDESMCLIIFKASLFWTMFYMSRAVQCLDTFSNYSSDTTGLVLLAYFCSWTFLLIYKVVLIFCFSHFGKVCKQGLSHPFFRLGKFSLFKARRI